MSDSDELTAAAMQLAEALVDAGVYDEYNCDPAIGNQENLAAFIRDFLTRWRLVPVEEASDRPWLWPLLSERYGPDNPGTTAAEQNLFAAGALWASERAEKIVRQHRAADELTRHDQDAGIYGDRPRAGQLFRNTITGSVFRYIGNGTYHPIMLGDQPARGAQLTWPYTYAMAGPLRPYHGPHED